MGCLYQLTSPSGKSYIGITMKTAEERFRRHVVHMAMGRRNAIHRAINKYGHEKFKVKTLAISNDRNYLRLIEKRAISAYETIYPNGYNLTGGGEGSPFWIDETIDKFRISRSKAWMRLTREERVSTTARAIESMTASRKDPLIEEPRRKQISDTMKRFNIGKGEGNAMAKLTEGCVARIKDMLACGVAMRLIAEYFNVSYSLISLIKQKQRWAHA